MKLLHAEDHPLVAQGIRHSLEGIADIIHVQTGREVVQLAGTQAFDGYIIDLDLPDMDGFSLIEEIRLRKPEARIVVCTMHDEIWTVRRLLLCGVDGLVLKSEAPSVLADCVRSVFEEGTIYYSTSFERLRSRALGLQRNDLLTDRELQVLRLVAEGENTQAIAEKLFLSENTIETHRRRIIMKLGARNITEAVAKAFKMAILKK